MFVQREFILIVNREKSLISGMRLFAIYDDTLELAP